MRVIYSRESFPTDNDPSIFLAGPTPRSKDVRSWRPDALKELEKQGFTNTVFVPEDRSGEWNETVDFDSQLAWEEEGLARSTSILFWIPRQLEDMPGFTTNLEFGRWMDSGKVVLGAPERTPKMNWLLQYVKKLGIPHGTTLEKTVYMSQLMATLPKPTRRWVPSWDTIHELPISRIASGWSLKDGSLCLMVQGPNNVEYEHIVRNM